LFVFWCWLNWMKWLYFLIVWYIEKREMWFDWIFDLFAKWSDWLVEWLIIFWEVGKRFVCCFLLFLEVDWIWWCILICVLFLLSEGDLIMGLNIYIYMKKVWFVVFWGKKLFIGFCVFEFSWMAESYDFLILDERVIDVWRCGWGV